MTTGIDPRLVTAQASEAELAIPFAQRLLETFTLLLEVDSQRRFERVLDQIVVDYMPFKFLVAFELASTVQEARKTSEEMTKDINQVVWGALAESHSSLFTPGDKQILLSALRWQLQLVSTWEEAGRMGHSESVVAAFVDGFWALQKADVCLSTAGFASRGLLAIGNAKTAHWLCLALRRAQQEFDDALFANSPELMKRLTTPGKTITNSELERRLGL